MRVRLRYGYGLGSVENEGGVVVAIGGGCGDQRGEVNAKKTVRVWPI